MSPAWAGIIKKNWTSSLMDYGNIKMSRMLQIFSEMGYMDENNKSKVLYGIQRIKNLLMDFMISVICG